MPKDTFLCWELYNQRWIKGRQRYRDVFQDIREENSFNTLPTDIRMNMPKLLKFASFNPEAEVGEERCWIAVGPRGKRKTCAK